MAGAVFYFCTSVYIYIVNAYSISFYINFRSAAYVCAYSSGVPLTSLGCFIFMHVVFTKFSFGPAGEKKIRERTSGFCILFKVIEVFLLFFCC